MSSARRRLDRFPEAATRFASKDGAISKRRLDRATSNDAFAIGSVVVDIDLIISDRPRRQTGAVGLVGFRTVGSSLVIATGFAGTLGVDFPIPLPFADIAESASSGRGYSAGWSGNVFAGRATPEVDGLGSMGFVPFAPRLYARYFASVASFIFSPLTVSLWVTPMCRAKFDFCPYSFAHFGQRRIFRATGSFGERTRRAVFFTLAIVRCELVANF